MSASLDGTHQWNLEAFLRPTFYLIMGKFRHLFIFRPFLILILQIEISIYCVFGIRTRGCIMVGTYETTELWRPTYFSSQWEQFQSHSYITGQKQDFLLEFGKVVNYWFKQLSRSVRQRPVRRTPSRTSPPGTLSSSTNAQTRLVEAPWGWYPLL